MPLPLFAASWRSRLLTSLSVAAALATGACAGSEHLRVGDPAPRFSLPLASAQGDGTLNLADRAGQWTVLYFYPKDGTPGCTKQACAFRDAIEPIRARGCEVYGISTDSTESHREFIAKHQLPFPLLADTEGAVAKQYGADGFAGFTHRWTFLLGPELVVRWLQRDVDPALNAQEIVTELERLQGTAAAE